MKPSLPEVWLRGPLPDMPVLLQPVAHALLQAREEVTALSAELPSELLWARPGGVASPGFHLQHLAGVLDRLFTYARGEQLSEAQWQTRETEGLPDGAGAQALLETFYRQVDLALAQLRDTDERMLTEARSVGRSGLPSTVLGLLVHAAEHTQRHTGQFLVTVRVLNTG